MSDLVQPFAGFATSYRRLGLWPRPISSGSKACHIKNWQKSDDQIPPGELDRWLRDFAGYGIGLLMGSPLPDGTKLAALDIDHDDYVRVAGVLLGNPPCGRIGSKGIVHFVRVRGEAKKIIFKIRRTSDRPGFNVGELLGSKCLCVIPPTIHPETGAPYRWTGTPLHEVELDRLPLLEMDE